MQPLRFILQALDPEYGHPAFETMFVVERPQELCVALGIGVEDDPDFERWYRLEPDEVAALTHHFGLAFDPEGRETFLYKWTGSRDVPYLIHTGYELVLMLEGRKQFARMHADFYPPDRHAGEDRFDRFVAHGLFHKEVELEKFDEPLRFKDGRVFEGFRTVYYTRKGEEWRIPAWKLVERASRKSGWNDTLERLEGMLFGYEDWQNDWWIEQFCNRQHRWGTSLVHLAVTSSELAAIENAGYRALPLPNRTLRILSSACEEHEDETRPLMEAFNAVALVRFRVKTRLFLELVNEKQERLHDLPAERVPDLNRLIIDAIEIVSRRKPAAR
jgi:hypothetical protein